MQEEKNNITGVRKKRIRITKLLMKIASSNSKSPKKKHKNFFENKKEINNNRSIHREVAGMFSVYGIGVI
ncbi:MAG: hypothetical protein WC010_01975 [Candidatus Absconditabacterales bacterium]